jgi:hypothetical protein
MSQTTNATAPRLSLAGVEPPRVAWVADRLTPGDALDRGAGYLFANVEGERSHVGMLPAQSAIVVTVATEDALALRDYILAWPGPGEVERR